jgi:hypothetical protein
MTNFEDEYLDVLQNIEFAIVNVYRQHMELTDYDVDKVLDVLIRAYRAERTQKPVQKPNLSEISEQVYEGVRLMCDWRLGREKMVSKEEDDNEIEIPMSEALGTDEIIACLKRIRKSIKKWGRLGGRQGYLQYIDQFIA